MPLSGIINTATTTTLVTAVAAKEVWRIGLSNNSTDNDVTVDIMVGPTGATVACPKAVKLYKAGSNTNNYEDTIVLNAIGDKIEVVTTTTDVVTYRTGGGV